MRNLEELYIILHKNYVDGTHGCQFICNLIHKMGLAQEINSEEYFQLLTNFKRNRPTEELHKGFFDQGLYSRLSWNWFGNGDEANVYRGVFLQYLIKNHKP